MPGMSGVRSGVSVRSGSEVADAPHQVALSIGFLGSGSGGVSVFGPAACDEFSGSRFHSWEFGTWCR